jgi:hypothetical protein
VWDVVPKIFIWREIVSENGGKKSSLNPLNPQRFHHPLVPTMMPSAISTILLFSQMLLTNSVSLSDRPTLKYGTAWKKESTSTLVYKAVLSGFRHIDTACQPRLVFTPGNMRFD